ncbi:MAG: hypothetical protein HY505_00360 [Candidatus Yanofskybacteria bacterium]|nr:hypothetical protein [Candidatus Yanofskybacteria bacterium]
MSELLIVAFVLTALFFIYRLFTRRKGGLWYEITDKSTSTPFMFDEVNRVPPKALTPFLNTMDEK